MDCSQVSCSSLDVFELRQLDDGMSNETIVTSLSDVPEIFVGNFIFVDCLAALLRGVPERHMRNFSMTYVVGRSNSAALVRRVKVAQMLGVVELLGLAVVQLPWSLLLFSFSWKVLWMPLLLFWLGKLG